MNDYLAARQMNMHVLVYHFVIKLRVFANVVQTQANQISGIPTSGFGYLKGACKCEYMRKYFEKGGYR